MGVLVLKGRLLQGGTHRSLELVYTSRLRRSPWRKGRSDAKGAPPLGGAVGFGGGAPDAGFEEAAFKADTVATSNNNKLM